MTGPMVWGHGFLPTATARQSDMPYDRHPCSIDRLLPVCYDLRARGDGRSLLAGAEVRGRLGDDLRALHRLAVPEGGPIDRGLDALRLACVRRVLVASADVEVLRRRTRTVNVPLPRLNLVRPAPYKWFSTYILQDIRIA